MKNLLILILIFSISEAVSAQDKKEVIKLSEPVFVTDLYEVYGAKTELNESSVSLSKAISAISDNNEKSITVNTTIAEVCEKKGCFFIAQDGENSARVTFKDYAFFIPTDSQGKEVIILGVLTKKTLSEDKAKHYAEDAGKNSDEIKGEQVEYSILASSIIIKKKLRIKNER